jgi:hypothetical protein
MGRDAKCTRHYSDEGILLLCRSVHDAGDYLRVLRPILLLIFGE